MTFPTITYKYNSLEQAKALTELVEQKFATLEKFLEIDADIVCDVEFEKIAAHMHGRQYRIEVNLAVDGDLYRSEATEETFEKAIDEVRHSLEQELRKAKDKQVTQEKDAGRDIKAKLFI